MPRGGRRRGAGAPKGNLNGLRNGRHSPRVLALTQRLLDEPDLRTLLRVLSQGSLRRLAIPRRTSPWNARARNNQRTLQTQIREK